jgi:hypothetical protein
MLPALCAQNFDQVPMPLLKALLATLQLQTAQLDTTIHVSADTRLDAAVSAGSIDVKTWNRSDVRIVAKMSANTRVNVSLDGAVLRISTSVRTGAVDVGDLSIMVPRAMSLTLGRGDVDITVQDSEGEVSVANYRGTINVSGGRRIISLKTNLGSIALKGARGRVDAVSANDEISMSDVVGDVRAVATNKHVTLDRVDSHNLQVESVFGVIRFTGPFHPDGRYSFTTHMGSIFANVVGDVDATVAVATVSGAFTSTLKYRVADKRRANIFTAVFGEGRAQVIMESFMGGMIVKPAQ